MTKSNSGLLRALLQLHQTTHQEGQIVKMKAEIELLEAEVAGLEEVK